MKSTEEKPSYEPSYELKEISTFTDLLSLKDSWEKLFEESLQSRSIFLSFEWQKHWIKEFLNNQSWLILVISEKGKCVAIVPLNKKEGNMSFIGDPINDYGNILIKDNANHKEIIRYVWSYLLENSNEKIVLDEIPFHSKFLYHSKKVLDSRPLGKKVWYDVSHANDTFALYIDSHNKKYLEKKVKNKDAKKRVRKLDQYGKNQMYEVKTKEQLTGAIKHLVAYHKTRWKNSSQKSMFDDEQFVKFFSQVSNELFEKKMIKVWVISMEEKPIIIDYGFYDNSTYTGFCQVYDPKYLNASPGLIIWNYIIQRGLDEGLRELDFSRGGESHKSRFCNVGSTNKTLTVYPSIFSFTVGKTYNIIKEIILRNKKLHNLTIKVRNLVT